jgi:hypothetical protein
MVMRCRTGTVKNSELGTAPDLRRIVRFAHAAPRPGKAPYPFTTPMKLSSFTGSSRKAALGPS